MRRWLLVTGLVVVVALASTAAVSYSQSHSNCATDLLSGNATNPSGCAADETALGVSILLALAAAVMTVVAGFVGGPPRKSRTPLGVARAGASPPDVRHDGADRGEADPTNRREGGKDGPVGNR